MRNSDPVWQVVDRHAPDFIALSDRVWGMPEILYEEYRSCEEHAAMLATHGFDVTRNAGGLPTAVVGSDQVGDGGPVIAFLGEYDALPGLSQQAGLDRPEPLEAGGHGHGCGHNLLGSAALLAAAALRDHLREAGVSAEVRYYGCPAEEGGAAKTFMVREGLFDDVDVAITWHPAVMTKVGSGRSLANTRMDFTFHGRAAHAAAAPHLGRSALDAVELTSVGVNYLREHVPADSRIHYAYLDAGGVAPNVVQAQARVRYSIRSMTLQGMFDLVERVQDIARGAALMTGTRMEARVFTAVSDMLENPPLTRMMQETLEALGGVPFDDADRAYAARIQATLGRDDIASAYRSAGLRVRTDEPLCDYVVPHLPGVADMIGSTDVADVSWKVPTVEARVATCAIGTPGHSWQITAQGKAPAAHKGMVHAAKAMATLGLRLCTDPAALAEARAAHAAQLTETPYVCPIPDDVSPPLRPRPA
ncbi:MAG: amidohydrolase [Alkalilacustris sp.]